jgi:hypothetical protein
LIASAARPLRRKKPEDDGENHDVPDALFRWLSTSFVKHVAKTYNDSVMIAEILQYVKDDGGFTPKEVALFTETMQQVMEQSGEVNADSGDILEAMVEKAKKHMVDKAISELGSSELIDEIDAFLEGEANK